MIKKTRRNSIPLLNHWSVFTRIIR